MATQEMTILFFDLIIHFAENQPSYTTLRFCPIYIKTDFMRQMQMMKNQWWLETVSKSEFSAIKTYTLLYSSHLHHLHVQIEYFIINSKRRLNSINFMSCSKPLNLGQREVLLVLNQVSCHSSTRPYLVLYWKAYRTIISAITIPCLNLFGCTCL